MDAITRVQCRLDELLKVHADAYQLAQGFAAPVSVDGEPLLVSHDTTRTCPNVRRAYR